MPTSFAMAVFADFCCAQIDVTKPSVNMIVLRKTQVDSRSTDLIAEAPPERIQLVKFHGTQLITSRREIDRSMWKPCSEGYMAEWRSFEPRKLEKYIEE